MHRTEPLVWYNQWVNQNLIFAVSPSRKSIRFPAFLLPKIEEVYREINYTGT